MLNINCQSSLNYKLMQKKYKEVLEENMVFRNN